MGINNNNSSQDDEPLYIEHLGIEEIRELEILSSKIDRMIEKVDRISYNIDTMLTHLIDKIDIFTKRS